jgi:DNA-3-methyladenine glycosylase II
MNIRLAVDGPLDAGATLARYRLWGEDPANRLAADGFRRVLRLEDRLLPYEVRWSGPVDAVTLAVRIPGARGARVAAAVAAEVGKIFGLGFDLPGFYRAAKADPVLTALVERLYGLRPTLTPSALEMLVGSITAQQVNLTFAFTLRARLVRRYGTPVGFEDGELYAFPTAAALGAARLASLRALQFSASKALAIRGVARALGSGALEPAALEAASAERVIESLTALRGLGRWTADWFLARCLGRGDVCPAGDLAVHKAFARHWGNGRPLDEAAIRRRAAGWGGHQNLAVHYLLAGVRLERAGAGGGT